MPKLMLTLFLVGTYYLRIMFVTGIETKTDSVVCDDTVGYEWAFYGTEGYEVGDMVIALMGDNGTEEIFDDYFINGYTLPIKCGIMERPKLTEASDEGDCRGVSVAVQRN